MKSRLRKTLEKGYGKDFTNLAYSLPTTRAALLRITGKVERKELRVIIDNRALMGSGGRVTYDKRYMYLGKFNTKFQIEALAHECYHAAQPPLPLGKEDLKAVLFEEVGAYEAGIKAVGELPINYRKGKNSIAKMDRWVLQQYKKHGKRFIFDWASYKETYCRHISRDDQFYSLIAAAANMSKIKYTDMIG